MKKNWLLVLPFLVGAKTLGWTDDDVLQFYKEEANVVSASLQPQPADQVPATVYVVTAQNIHDSGAQTIPDALRAVPGVEVMQSRTGQASVSIRGTPQIFSNHILLLVDGRRVSESIFDAAIWSYLPPIDEIDRIEVVEGPASAVYGGNAVDGVIQIITKRPEQLQGGVISYGGGERSTQMGHATYGREIGKDAFRVAGAYDSTNRYEDASLNGFLTRHVNGLYQHQFANDAKLDFTGGATDVQNEYTALAIGQHSLFGTATYGQTDFTYKDFKLFGSWDQGREATAQNLILANTPLNYSDVDISIQQALKLPFGNQAALGGSYRHNQGAANFLTNGREAFDLYSGYGEDRISLGRYFSLNLSGRVDSHPLTPLHFSPRGTLLYTPLPKQVFSVSAGTAFRNPTMQENFLQTTVVAPLAPSETLQVKALPNTTLSPESVQTVEIDHRGEFGRFKMDTAGFHERYKNPITPEVGSSAPTFSPAGVLLPYSIQYVNSADSLTTWGVQENAEFIVTSSLRLFGNYTYLDATTDSGSQLPAAETPRHMANTGFHFSNHGFTMQWTFHWVDKTGWPDNSVFTYLTNERSVPAYWEVNGFIGYAFSKSLQGLEIGLSGLNIFNRAHYELLGTASQVNPGQAGEIVHARVIGTVRYKFSNY